MRTRTAWSATLLVAVACSGDKGSDGDYYGESDSYSTSDGGAYITEDDPLDDPADTGTGIECDEETPVALYMSPDDSNSMASPVLARQLVTGGEDALRRFSIRPWEFMNYYDFAYTPADDLSQLRVSAELAVSDSDEAGEYGFQVAVTSAHMDEGARPALNLALSLDTSGSMEGTPLELSQATARAIAGSLQKGDIISMVTWDSSSNVVLKRLAVNGPDDRDLLSAIDDLTAGGSTDLSGGLSTAYSLVETNFAPGLVNRVLLISDGGANVGQTDANLIGRMADDSESEGIYMVGVGVGTASTYRDDLMDTVSDLGKGASLFIDSTAEAERMFGDRFVTTVGIAARDVRIEVDLPPGFEIVRTTAEEVSTDPDDIEPQHLAPDDSMVFNQTIRTCAPELVSDQSEVTVKVLWNDPLTYESHETASTWTFGELLKGDTRLLLKGQAVAAYAGALRAWKADERTQEIYGEALWSLEVAEVANTGDPDLAEIRTILEALGSD